MARIALVVPALGATGGVSSVAAFLLTALEQRSDHEVRLISLATASRDPASVPVHDPRRWLRGVATHEGTFRGRAFTHVGALAGDVELARYRPRRALDAAIAACDMVQIVCGTPAWAWPFHRARVPVSMQVATLARVERRAKRAGWRGPLGLWRRTMLAGLAPLETKALRACAAVQVENRWMEDHVRALTASTGTDVRHIPPGVDTGQFHPVTGPREGGYFLSVGRLGDARKNHRLLLEAYRRIAGRPGMPDLVLAGPDAPPGWMSDLMAGPDLAGRVRIERKPDADRLAALYRHADAFVLASDEEGFGVTVIEAMASGRPPVSTRSGGPDGIITDGVDGFLVDRDDVDGLATRLADLAADPARADVMGNAARQTAERTYGLDVTQTGFVAAIDAVLARGRMT